MGIKTKDFCIEIGVENFSEQMKKNLFIMRTVLRFEIESMGQDPNLRCKIYNKKLIAFKIQIRTIERLVKHSDISLNKVS